VRVTDIAAVPASSPPAPHSAERAMEVAREFEAQFIAQMLTHAKLTDALSNGSGFGGEAMANMLVNAWADRMAEAGGFGLAPLIAARLEKS
jgi:Rod binding domain-containing protein